MNYSFVLVEHIFYLSSYFLSLFNCFAYVSFQSFEMEREKVETEQPFRNILTKMEGRSR